MRSRNPGFNRMRSAPAARDEATWPPDPRSGAPGAPTPEELARLHRQPSGLTIDDVIMHTLGLFGLAGVGGAVGWLLVPGSPGLVMVTRITWVVLSPSTRFR